MFFAMPLLDFNSSNLGSHVTKRRLTEVLLFSQAKSGCKENYMWVVMLHPLKSSSRQRGVITYLVTLPLMI